jgi:hypothetical protein
MLYTTVQNQFNALSHLKNQIGEMAHHFIGHPLLFLTGYYVEKTEQGFIGNGEINDKVRITYINGILNAKAHTFDSSTMISESHGGSNVHYFYRPTEGWTRDFLMCFMIKMGLLSSESQNLAAGWRQLIQEMGGVNGGGRIIHYAHSLGGSETDFARQLLTPEELRMISVVTFGSACIIANGGFSNVANYISCRDGIYLFSPIDYIKGALDSNSNVIFVGSLIDGWPLMDHFFCGDNYRLIVEKLGRQFIETYGSISKP